MAKQTSIFQFNEQSFKIGTLLQTFCFYLLFTLLVASLKEKWIKLPEVVPLRSFRYILVTGIVNEIKNALTPECHCLSTVEVIANGWLLPSWFWWNGRKERRCVELVSRKTRPVHGSTPLIEVVKWCARRMVPDTMLGTLYSLNNEDQPLILFYKVVA